MARIPQRFIDDLLDRVDIVDVVSSRIDLRKAGKNYSARCPFHDEKTPSFSVSPDKQFYYCFGCGAGGNAIGFVMDHDHLNFPEAVETLARQCGMEVPKESSADTAGDSYRRQLYRILEQADHFYRRQLRQHGDKDYAVNYLKNRGLTGSISSKFGIGFAPQGWDNLITALSENDQDVKLLKDAGLVVEKDDNSKRTYDRFRNRIIFPIRDTRGRTIGFGGRVLDDSKPKYLNSPETPVFHKGRELYGLFEAHKILGEIKSLLLVEGYMDVVALNQHGIHNVVATLGTAATQDHLDKLFRYASEVIFCFDGDSAGLKAANRALDTCLSAMQDGRSARFLFLPDGEDPDTLVRKLGHDGFTALVDEAQPLSEFLFHLLESDINTATPDGKARLSQAAAPLINKIPKGVFHQLMLKELAKRTDMDIDTLASIIAPPPQDIPESDQSGTELSPPPLDTYDSYYESLPETGPGSHPNEPPRHRVQTHKKLKLSPVQRLILLLLHTPELRKELESLSGLESYDDPEIGVLVDLCELLNENPHYSLNHVLSYYGQDRRETLARIVAADMMGHSSEHARDNLAECRDICRHLQLRIAENQPPTVKLDQLLQREALTEMERKQLSRLWFHDLQADEKTTQRYELVRTALTGKKTHKN
jgi:DNA primase